MSHGAEVNAEWCEAILVTEGEDKKCPGRIAG